MMQSYMVTMGKAIGVTMPHEKQNVSCEGSSSMLKPVEVVISLLAHNVQVILTCKWMLVVLIVNEYEYDVYVGNL